MTRHKNAALRRTDILDAASRCFAKQGYHATRIDEIAREAGLSKGGVYFHFASKEAIFDALHDRQQQMLREAIESVRTSPLPPALRLFSLAELLTQRIGDSDDRQSFSLTLGEKGLQSPAVRARVVEAYERYLQVAEELIDEGIRSGNFRPLHARSVAQILKYLVDGMEYGLALGYRANQAELLQTFMELFARGLLADATVEKAGEQQP
jgi:AcrR family transcriptional regulator